LLKRLGGLSKTMIDKTRSMLAADNASVEPLEPVIIPAGEHGVTAKVLSSNAHKVLKRLNDGGFDAYLVGGGVRDALVGLKPKDFDVATNASPEEVRGLFRNSRIIGRRFRLVHVVFGRDIIEVATFRASHDKGDGGEIGESGRIVRDNVFGTIAEDAIRRDFSVNALYYSIADGAVVDYVGGLNDIDDGIFRLIGDPVTRCEEDPVRVLRAVRLSAKLEFDIEAATLDAMRATASELSKTPPARLFEEVLKLFQGGYALRSFQAVRDHDLLQYLFPLLAKRFAQNPDGRGTDALEQTLSEALANTDKRVSQNKPITPAYLLAFMLWPDVDERTKRYANDGMSVVDSFKKASDEVMAEQIKVISIPKRFSGPMREIWHMQPRLEQWKGGRALKLIESRRFRAAYDFLCLRSSTDEHLRDLVQWWTKVQELDEESRAEYVRNKPVVYGIWSKQSGPPRHKRRARRGPPRRRRSKKPSAGDNNSSD